MSVQKNLTCIVCPVGCSMEITLEEGKIVNIEGNTCKRGAEYAASEILNPTRTLTSTVRVQNGVKPVVSVKSAKPLPKDLLLKCMERINSVSLTAPVHIGDCILANIMETGVDIVASSRVELKD